MRSSNRRLGIGVGDGWAHGASCRKSCQRKQESASAIGFSTPGTCTAAKEKLNLAAAIRRLRTRRMMHGTLEVLELRIATTALLSDLNRICCLNQRWPHVCRDNDGRKLFVGNREGLLAGKPETVKPLKVEVSTMAQSTSRVRGDFHGRCCRHTQVKPKN